MTLRTLSRTELAAEMGYIDTEGRPSARAVAQLLRDALGRWGLSPRRALLKHARDQLRAVDLEGDIVTDILRRLVALGECAEVSVGHESYIAPGERRWVAVGGQVAALLGPGVPPATTQPIASLSHDDIVVRVRVESEDEAAVLEADGSRQVSLAEWLQPAAHLLHAARRLGAPARGDQLGLAEFWELLTGALVEDGLPLGPEAEIRVLAGPVGGFFGHYAAAAIEGRWTADPPPGVWCAYRRGHGDGHWLPILIEVAAQDRRSLDLFDHDEWRWALLARSRAIGPAEVVRRANGEESVTWQLPDQVSAAMGLCGPPAGPWRWRIADDAPDVWGLLK